MGIEERIKSAKDKAFSSTRPMLFENDCRDYLYSIRGTCFIVSCLSHVFVLTSKHGLKNWEIEQLRIPLKIGKSPFIPLDLLKVPNPKSPSDRTATDFLILKSPRDKYLSNEFEMLSAHPLDWGISKEKNLGQGPLCFQGFPMRKNTINYETGIITPIYLRCDAEYDEKDSNDSHIHWLKFEPNNTEISCINGLSGAPVFQFTLDARNSINYKWAGLLITGSYKHGKASFISSEFICKSLLPMINPTAPATAQRS